MTEHSPDEADDDHQPTCTFTSDDIEAPSVSVRNSQAQTVELPSLTLEILGVKRWGCSRPAWNHSNDDDSRCVWHADASDKPLDELEATIGNGDLHGAIVPSETRLSSLTFPDESRFIDADLSGANLFGADLSEADFSGANLSEANLRSADLSEANFSGANLSEANLRSADLSEANLRQAILDRTGLYETNLQAVDIDEGTTARPPALWEQQEDEAAESGWINWTGVRRLRALGRSESNPDGLQWAEQQYRRIERLYREHDLRPDPSLAVQEKHARRKRALAEGERFQWFRRAFARWVFGYGLQVGPIIGVMLAVILVCTLVYPVVGFEDGTLAVGTATGTVAYETMPPALSWETAVTLGRSLYFSTITFSTLGYGDLAPTGWARAIATAESFIGALSMAYLVSVLSRRVIR